MKIARFQVEISESKMKELESLMLQGAAMATKKDLFNNALALLEWALNEKKKGRIIGSIDEQENHYKELVIPMFASIEQRMPKETVSEEQISSAQEDLYDRKIDRPKLVELIPVSLELL